MDKTKSTAAAVRGAPQIHTNEFKHAAVTRMKTCVSVLALKLGVRRNLLHKWAKVLEASGMGDMFRSRGHPPIETKSEVEWRRSENTRLELEDNILKKAQAYFTGRKA